VVVANDNGNQMPAGADADLLLSIRGARVVRNGTEILHVESLDVRRGEHVALLGPNGAGKSTLLRLVTRDVRPIATEPPAVTLAGRSRWDLFEARRVFGLVSDALQEDYDRAVSVHDAVLSGYFGSIGVWRRDEVTPEMRTHAEALMAQLDIAELAERRMDTLSTGEARRALIARALVHDPPALILDEPCDGLDPGVRARFIDTVRDLARGGHTLVMVTHHIADIVPEIDRVVMLSGGHVIADGRKCELLTSERVSELFGAVLTVTEREGFFELQG